MVFDHQTFWLDLEAAKADLEANVTTGYRVDVSFRPEYIARQALEGKPPSPKNWAEYVRKMSENKALFAKVSMKITSVSTRSQNTVPIGYTNQPPSSGSRPL